MHTLQDPTVMRKTLAFPLFLSMIVLAAPISPAPAQSTTESANTQQEPPTEPANIQYWLRVTGQRVNIRSRADLNSRIVGRANHDDVLEGRGSENGWHKIVPPTGVFSLVATQYIERLGDDRGLVKVDTSLRVRVGSDIQPRDPMLSEVQTRLQHDAEVKILGQLDSEWLKIAPPKDVHVYISADYVEHITAEVAKRPRSAKPTADEPTTPATASPADVSKEPEPTTQPVEQPDLTGRWGKRLGWILKLIEEEERKPQDEQAWAAVASHLQPIVNQREEPRVAQLAAAWLKKANRLIEHQAVAREARRITGQTPPDQVRHDRAPDEIRRAEGDLKPRPEFDARGVLQPSFAIPAGPYGLRYKLEDPFTHKVAAYIEISPELGINATGCVGKYVGVRGDKQSVEGVSVSILRVTRLTVLDPEKPATPPAREKP